VAPDPAVSAPPDEFSLIAELFAPLSLSYPGAMGLRDDAAFMDPPPGMQVVATVDAMVAGVHFFADDPADLVARKLIRVNLSDLAAKGAVPFALMLAAAFPRNVSADWLRLFAAGLKSDVEEFAVALIGGDTVATPGPLTLSLTAFGTVPAGKGLLRRSARPGDRIWVTGSIGDSAVGLQVLLGNLTGQDPSAVAYVVDRYRVPSPRTRVGPQLIGLASASMDVSDGLVQDLGHLCRESGVGALVRQHSVPLSPAVTRMTGSAPGIATTVLTGGDDYELLFTARPEMTDELKGLSRQTGVNLTEIGEIIAGQGVTVLSERNEPVDLPSSGWLHFSGEAE
jgi:thiamine-monophosphate kinase